MRKRRNPVPPASSTRDSVKAAALRAARQFEDFTGHPGKTIARIEKPVYPDAVSVIGECDGVLYTTVRDGEKEAYIHRFRKTSRPLLCVSPDGKTLYLLGGAYRFTERGIVDTND